MLELVSYIRLQQTQNVHLIPTYINFD